MRFQRVAAYHQETVCRFHFGYAVGHRPATESRGQTCHSWGMSEAGAMVNVIGTDDGAGKLHENEVLLIGTFSRRKETDGVGAIIPFDMTQIVTNDIQRFIPACWLQSPVSLDQGGG